MTYFSFFVGRDWYNFNAVLWNETLPVGLQTCEHTHASG